jgi:hypothetical protein
MKTRDKGSRRLLNSDDDKHRNYEDISREHQDGLSVKTGTTGRNMNSGPWYRNLWSYNRTMFPTSSSSLRPQMGD